MAEKGSFPWEDWSIDVVDYLCCHVQKLRLVLIIEVRSTAERMQFSGFEGPRYN